MKPFLPLPLLSYEVIVVDPPWPFDLYSDKGNKKSAAAQYRIMTMQDIFALPVGHLAAPGSICLLWVTAPQLKGGMAALEKWGFTYKSTLIWRKLTVNGLPRMGTGYWARSMHEQVLIGTNGRPRRCQAFPSVFDGIAREHSRKPDEFYDLVRDRTHGRRRCDLFSRESRWGFEGWGIEHGKFD